MLVLLLGSLLLVGHLPPPLCEESVVQSAPSNLWSPIVDRFLLSI
uniref:Uncharacterized protein n=1 Tax=Sphingomonas sp. NS2 TaxID=908605 RepID=A0A0D4ZYP1_9SPHN|nr:hypothetical protein plasmid201_081 [Sphingomonas sp. NS2]